MIIVDGKQKSVGSCATAIKSGDILDCELINSLGCLVGEMRDGARYDIESICVETGICKFNVCGMIDVADIITFSHIIGDDGIRRDVEEFYLD